MKAPAHFIPRYFLIEQSHRRNITRGDIKISFMSQNDFLLALQPELYCRGGITRMKDKETWEEEEIITRIWTNESMKGKQFFAVRTCGLPQIEPDLMYNMTVIICFITVIRLIIITSPSLSSLSSPSSSWSWTGEARRARCLQLQGRSLLHGLHH